MLETKEKKQVFAGCIVLIVILGLVSLWSHPQFQYQDNTNYQALQQKSNSEQQTNNQYLASLGTTEAAQQAVMDQILPQSQVEAEVAAELNANQPIVIPVLADKEIKISPATGKTALQNYLNQTNPLFDKLKASTDSVLGDLYNSSGDPNNINSLTADANMVLSQYQKTSVPKEAADFHKQMVVALESFIDLLQNSKTYMAGSNANPWPEVYKDQYVIGKTMAVAGTDFSQLNVKYNLLGSSDQQEPVASGNMFIPAASAQMATIDIWQKAQAALEEAAATSISKYVLGFLDKLANKIESSYRISNFLYYSDALVSGQYLDDYLNKYVSDPLDRTMIKNFVPQVSCGKNGNYNQALQAKANQYLGFDPSTLNPGDPQYYQKLARVGDFLSSPQGWNVQYQGLAAQAQGAAQNAANNEILSPGQKAGRNNSGIVTPSQISSSAMTAIFQRYLSEGSDTSAFVTTQQIASQIMQTFLNNFVLKGVVLIEQKTCIAVPQVQLVTQVLQ
jgi:hypothetical protein